MNDKSTPPPEVPAAAPPVEARSAELPPEVPAPDRIVEVSLDDYAISERLPAWHRRVLSLLEGKPPTTKDGWAAALSRALAERI